MPRKVGDVYDALADSAKRVRVPDPDRRGCILAVRPRPRPAPADAAQPGSPVARIRGRAYSRSPGDGVPTRLRYARRQQLRLPGVRAIRSAWRSTSAQARRASMRHRASHPTTGRPVGAGLAAVDPAWPGAPANAPVRVIVGRGPARGGGRSARRPGGTMADSRPHFAGLPGGK